MSKYKIGDRVRIKNNAWFIKQRGKEGTIIVSSDYWHMLGIEFDEEIKGGNSCYGKGKDGYCYYIFEDEIELVKEKSKITHIVKMCNINNCNVEAEYWIPTEGMSGDFDLKGEHTFYLCANHMTDISNDDGDYYIYLNPETGRIRKIEIGMYACNENCEICNDIL